MKDCGAREFKDIVQYSLKAIIAFLEGNDFEDVIRTAVSLGGDCDTLTAIAGSIAEAYYGISYELKNECYQRLDWDLRKVLGKFEQSYQFDESTAHKYHPLYWFSRDKSGLPCLDTPGGKRIVVKEKNEMFNTSKQAIDGWRRAKMYMKIFGVWDATMFGAWMGATLAYGPFVNESGEEYIYTLWRRIVGN